MGGGLGATQGVVLYALLSVLCSIAINPQKPLLSGAFEG